MSWSDWGYRPSRPPRPADGIQARTQRGPFGNTWWAGRWIAALERLVDARRLARGRSYARWGQVVQLDVGPEGIRALVQGSRARPYKVSIRFAALADSGWERAIAAMAAEAIYAARLLAGEMPERIEEVFQGAGASLFPKARGDLVSECSCPDWANPCKHVSAVYYLLGERFDADPFLMFLLRGRRKGEILDALRARRAMAAGEEAAEEPVGEAEPAEAGAQAPEAFWSIPGADLGVGISLEPPAVDALPVKRLGPPPFWTGPEDFTAIMEAAYRAVAAEALRLAVGEDLPEAGLSQ